MTIDDSSDRSLATKDAGSQSVTMRRLQVAAVVLVGLIGLMLRLWAVGRTPIDADTAVVGLMAHEILHGHFFAFYWGQHYGGVEPYVVAGVFAIFGQSTFTLSIAPMLLDIAAAVLVWRIGRRVFSSRVGIAGALLFWIWPEVYIRQSTIEHGFRFAALVCGLGLLLIAFRLGENNTRSTAWRHIDWCAYGLLCGIGFWSTPEIAYYVVPSIALLIWRRVHGRVIATIVDLVAVVVFAGIGALPWLYDNVNKHFPSLRHAPQPNPGGSPFVHHAIVFAVHVLPMVLGLRLPTSGTFLFPAGLSWSLYVVILIAIALFLIRLIRTRTALVVVAFVVAFPLIYAYSPFTWYWADGRYAVFLAPILALFVIAGFEDLARVVRYRIPTLRSAAAGSRWAIALGLALTLGATGFVAPYVPVSFHPLGRAGWFTWQTDPTGYAARIDDALLADGIHDLYAGYWLAYPMTFASRGSLLATDLHYGRYAPYVSDVEHSKDPAWLFVSPGHLPAAKTLLNSSELDPGCAVLTDTCLTPAMLESYLQKHHIAFTTYTPSYFVAIVPARPVDPIAVLDAFGVQH